MCSWIAQCQILCESLFHSAQSFRVLSVAGGNPGKDEFVDEFVDDTELIELKELGDEQSPSDSLSKSSTTRKGGKACRWPEQVASTDPDACRVVDETASS